MAKDCKARSKGRCKDAGKIVNFQVADSYARYMILSYTELVQLFPMDGYDIPEAHMRGLNEADIRAMV